MDLGAVLLEEFNHTRARRLENSPEVGAISCLFLGLRFLA